jgi:glycerol-3-phosphate dehydrogenase
VCDASPQGGGRTKEVFAPVVINATGVWADDVRGMVGGKPRLRRLRGSHLIFPAQRLPLARSVNVLHPKDGRPVFAYTWEGVTIVGTTDLDHTPPLEIDPPISQAEVEYLLAFVQRAFPGQSLQESDIQGTFSGIRSVVDTGKTNPSKESREYVLWTEAGLLTITGGKLTTFRLMALAALQAIRERLPHRLEINSRHRILNPVPGETISTASLSPAMRLRLLGRYGSSAAALIETSQSGELDSIGGSLSTWAELRWAAHNEAVVHLDDLLLRRVRLGLLLPKGGLNHSERIRAIVQDALGWDYPTWEKELARYAALWQKSYHFDRYVYKETI